jgi:hypothetical protein
MIDTSFQCLNYRYTFLRTISSIGFLRAHKKPPGPANSRGLVNQSFREAEQRFLLLFLEKEELLDYYGGNPVLPQFD